MTKKNQTPTTLVIFGATGDLMAKKIVPALFHAHIAGTLPEPFSIIGVSRRDWSDDDFRAHVAKILDERVKDHDKNDAEKFLARMTYHKLAFDDVENYQALKMTLSAADEKADVCSNKLFYLSVPPQFYEIIFDNLHAAKLGEGCGVADEKDPSWTRIIVEKPFGRDEASAKLLDEKLAKLFREDQIYRIDHYLAKEAFQNILAFRFFNNLFENQWGSDLIERVHVRQLETAGLEERGDSYDGVGALRDVGQNHLLQMVALAAMDAPKNFEADAVRDARAKILETLAPLSQDDMATKTIRAQYDGFTKEKGVTPDSKTETYFRVEFSLTHPRWKGVPFVIESGKKIDAHGTGERVTEIEVTFKHNKPCTCADAEKNKHFKNSLIFRQDPKEGIILKLWVKKPGRGMELEERIVNLAPPAAERPHAAADYEKLLMDCIIGDQTLFVSSREIRAMWRFIDPIIEGWQSAAVPLKKYKAGELPPSEF